MRLATGETFTSYDVIDKTSENPLDFHFTSCFGATLYIQELLTEFETDPKKIVAFARTYDEHGNLLTEDKFF